MILPPAQSIQIILPIASIVFLVLSFKRTIYGVISYFIIMNAKIGDMYPALGAIRFELLAAIVVFISIFLSKGGIENASPRNSELNKPLWVLFIVGLLSIPQAMDVAFSWEHGGYPFLKNILFYIMIVSAIKDIRDLRKIVLAFVLITAWIAYEPVVNYLNGIGGTYKYGEVAVGSFGVQAGHVALSNNLNQCIPMVFFIAHAKKSKVFKGILYGILAFLVLGVIFTKSRGGFVGLLIITLGFIYLSKNRAKAFMLGALAFMFLLPFAGEEYLSHMRTIEEGIHGGRSQMDRYLGLVNGISMMIKRPLLGVGIGCYPRARKIYFGYYFWSHNLYGELFGELGLSSAAWFYWIYVVFKKILLLKGKLIEYGDEESSFLKNTLNGVQLGLIFRLIIGNFTHSAFIWFWFLMAAIIVSIDTIVAKSYGPHQTD